MTARILTPRLQKRSDVAGGAKHLPKPYKLRRYYTPAEVKVHNNADDCWVTFFNQVYDLTPLIQDNYGALCEPIIKAAGSDITHWFDPKSNEVSKSHSATDINMSEDWLVAVSLSIGTLLAYPSLRARRRLEE